MVCNLADLDGFVQREILQRFDLENLNARAEFMHAVPTTENLCTVITIFCSVGSPLLIWKRYALKKP